MKHSFKKRMQMNCITTKIGWQIRSAKIQLERCENSKTRAKLKATIARLVEKNMLEKNKILDKERAIWADYWNSFTD